MKLEEGGGVKPSSSPLRIGFERRKLAGSRLMAASQRSLTARLAGLPNFPPPKRKASSAANQGERLAAVGAAGDAGAILLAC